MGEQILNRTDRRLSNGCVSIRKETDPEDKSGERLSERK